MDRYYKSRNRSRSRSPRSPRKRGHSDTPRIGNLPDYIPLVSSSSHGHSSESDRRSRSSRDRRLSPEKNKYRPLSPPRREEPPRRPVEAPRRQISPPPLDNVPNIRHRNDRNLSRSQSPNASRRSSRTTSSERFNRSSVFERLGASQGRPHSPIRYEESYRPIENQQYDDRDMNPVRIVVRNDNFQGSADTFNGNRTVTANDLQAEIIYSIRHLEQKNRENMKHIHGVRMTVENYQREIYKLEQIVLQTNQEIDKLKSRLSFV